MPDCLLSILCDTAVLFCFAVDLFLPFGQDNGDASITFYRTWTGIRYFREEGKFYTTVDNFISPTIRVPNGFPIGDNFYYNLYVSMCNLQCSVGNSKTFSPSAEKGSSVINGRFK